MNTASITCPVCSADGAKVFFELLEMPVFIGVQWPSRDQARGCDKGDLRLAYCGECGFIWNVAFDPKLVEYSQQYDNSLHFSSVFQEYTAGLVKRLIEDHDLHEKHVIDIGCGKGDFLAMLCEAGGNSGTGFDPSYEGARVSSSAADRMTFFQDLYSEKYADRQADLLCSRYVFEHIADPLPFLRMIRRSIGSAGGSPGGDAGGGADTSVVYFEVPNVNLILRDLSVWDIIYEHCSYFGKESLARVFAECGFKIGNVTEAYSGQFLGIEAFPGENGAQFKQADWGDLDALGASVETFTANYAKKLDVWNDRLASFERDGRRAVAWGAGAKAVGFLNMLKIDEQIPYVVDINPHKCGRHLAGTGQKVVAPEFLKDYRPDVVILMNPIYRDEIRNQLDEMEVEVEFIDA